MASEERYKTFEEVYPFYLNEHQNTVLRRLYVIGTSLALSLLLESLVTKIRRMWWEVVSHKRGFNHHSQ